MTICIDTNVLVQIFGRAVPFSPMLDALRHGHLTLAVSTEILLEYREVIGEIAGPRRWADFVSLLSLLAAIHNNVREVNPQFRFAVISADPDDNKFVDCAIAANCDYIVTSDRHFDALRGSGYKPQPIEPQDFIAAHLSMRT